MRKTRKKLGWGSTLVFQVTIGSLVGIAVVTIGWIISVIGLAVPAKAILGKKSA